MTAFRIFTTGNPLSLHSPNNLILFEILNSNQKDTRESRHTAKRTTRHQGPREASFTQAATARSRLPSPVAALFHEKESQGQIIWHQKSFSYPSSKRLQFFKAGAGFPGGASGQEPTSQCRRQKRYRFNLWVRKSPWRRAWQPTPEFLPGDPTDRGAWWATIHRDAESDKIAHARKTSLKNTPKQSSY